MEMIRKKCIVFYTAQDIFSVASLNNMQISQNRYICYQNFKRQRFKYVPGEKKRKKCCTYTIITTKKKYNICFFLFG